MNFIIFKVFLDFLTIFMQLLNFVAIFKLFLINREIR